MTPVDPEDRLRAILRAEAEQVTPAGDGLSRIQQRVAARNARRRWLVPATAAAALVVVVGGGIGYLTMTGSDDEQRITPVTPRSSTPSPSATSPTPSPSPTFPPFPANAIYPYTTGQQVVGATDGGASASDPAKVAQSFVSDYLDMAVLDRVVDKQVGPDAATVTIGRRLPSESKQVVPATRVHLVRWADGDRSAWVVVGADSDYLSVTGPVAGATVSTPVRVSGRITGVDESIEVDVRQRSSARPLGTTHTPGGGQQTPWSATVPFSAATDDVGAVVAWTSSALDGAPARVVVVAVRFHGGATAAAPAYWVGSKSGRITTFATRNGASLRYLTTPPAGRQDLLATLVGADVLFVRRPLDGACGDELWTVPFAGGTSDRVATLSAAVAAIDATGPGDYAYASAACTDATVSLVVVDAGKTRTVALPNGAGVGGVARAADGAVAVAVHSGSSHELRVLPAGATTFAAGRQVTAPDAGCFLTAPAYAGRVLATAELCGSGGPRLVTYDAATLKLRGRGPTLPGDLEVGRLVGADSGALIGQVAGGDAIGDVFVVENGVARVIRKAEGCNSTQTAPYPCTQDPSW